MAAQRSLLNHFNRCAARAINKEASRFYQPPRLRLQRNGAIFLMRSHPALQRRGLQLPPRGYVFHGLGLEQEALIPALARRGECAEFKKSREASFEKAKKGWLGILRSLLIDARAANRLKRI